MEMLIRPAQQEPAATQAKTGGRAATAESASGVNHSFNNLLAFLLGGTAQQVTGTREVAAEPDPELADDGEAPELGFGGDVLLLGVVHTPHELVPPAATVALSLGGDQLVPGITGDAGEQSKSGTETGVPLPAPTDEDVLPGGMTPRTAQATPLDGQPALAERVPETHGEVVPSTQPPAPDGAPAGQAVADPAGSAFALTTSDSLPAGGRTAVEVTQPANRLVSDREQASQRGNAASPTPVSTSSPVQAPSPLTIAETEVGQQRASAPAAQLQSLEVSPETEGLLASRRVEAGNQPVASTVVAATDQSSQAPVRSVQDQPDISPGAVTHLMQSTAGQRGSMQAFSDAQSRQPEDQRPPELQLDTSTTPVRLPTDGAVTPVKPVSSLDVTPPAQAGETTVEHLTRRIQELAQGGQSSVRLRLEPESLGTVDVRLIERQGTIEVQLIAASPEAREALGSGLQHLRRGLAESGVLVQRIEVHAALAPPEATSASSGDLLGFASSHSDRDPRREQAARTGAMVEHDPAQRQSTDEEELVNVPVMPSRHHVDFRA